MKLRWCGSEPRAVQHCVREDKQVIQGVSSLSKDHLTRNKAGSRVVAGLTATRFPPKAKGHTT